MTAVININFHGIGTPPRGAPAGEATMWVSRDAFRRILDRVGAERQVRLTFDDGHASDREIALEELTERGLRATFFLVVHALDSPGRLCVDDVRALLDAGMSIGSHGLQHRPWRALGPPELDAELRESRAALEEIAGGEVAEAACPFGSYDRAVLRQARRAGYRCVFTSDGGHARAGAFVQPRTSVRAWDDDRTVERILHPPRLSRGRRWCARQVKSWR